MPLVRIFSLLVSFAFAAETIPELPGQHVDHCVPFVRSAATPTGGGRTDDSYFVLPLIPATVHREDGPQHSFKPGTLRSTTYEDLTVSQQDCLGKMMDQQSSSSRRGSSAITASPCVTSWIPESFGLNVHDGAEAPTVLDTDTASYRFKSEFRVSVGLCAGPEVLIHVNSARSGVMGSFEKMSGRPFEMMRSVGFTASPYEYERIVEAAVVEPGDGSFRIDVRQTYGGRCHMPNPTAFRNPKLIFKGALRFPPIWAVMQAEIHLVVAGNSEEGFLGSRRLELKLVKPIEERVLETSLFPQHSQYKRNSANKRMLVGHVNRPDLDQWLNKGWQVPNPYDDRNPLLFGLTTHRLRTCGQSLRLQRQSSDPLGRSCRAAVRDQEVGQDDDPFRLDHVAAPPGEPVPYPALNRPLLLSLRECRMLHVM